MSYITEVYYVVRLNEDVIDYIDSGPHLDFSAAQAAKDKHQYTAGKFKILKQIIMLEE